MKGKISINIILKYLKRSDVAFQSTVTRMTINTTVSFELIDFIVLLTMFHNLKSLQLSSAKLNAIVGPGERRVYLGAMPNFKQLKQLSFGHESDSRILQCFTNTELTTLIFREQNFTCLRVWDFLLTQSGLKEIDFCRSSSLTFFDFNTDPFPATFKLNKIVLDYKSMLDFNGIMYFLLRQPTNFEITEIIMGHIPDPSIYVSIFSNLKNLKTLHLMPGSIGSYLNNGLALQLQPLLSVKSLRLYNGVNYGFDLKSIEGMTIKVIENLPNLENFELFVPYKQIYYETIVANLKLLKSLTIQVTFDTKLDELKYPQSVERLRINCFNFAKYFEMHPPITMVTNPEEKEICAAVRSLTYEGIANEEFFGFIQKAFPMLELLEVRKQLAKFERTRVTCIRQVNYRDCDFFVQKMRFF